VAVKPGGVTWNPRPRGSDAVEGRLGNPPPESKVLRELRPFGDFWRSKIGGWENRENLIPEKMELKFDCLESRMVGGSALITGERISLYDFVAQMISKEVGMDGLGWKLAPSATNMSSLLTKWINLLGLWHERGDFTTNRMAFSFTAQIPRLHTNF